MKNTPIRFTFLVVLGMITAQAVRGQQASLPDTTAAHYQFVSQRLLQTGLQQLGAFDILKELISIAPKRMSGTPGFERAKDFAEAWMNRHGLDNVHPQPVVVPRWERGSVESAFMLAAEGKTQRVPLSVCALGGSIATPLRGIAAEILEVHSFDDLADKGTDAKGKIVFFNTPMDPTNISTRDAYRAVARYRTRGAAEASRLGAVAMLVRSMTLARDDVPHTGTQEFPSGARHIPAAALGRSSADALAATIKEQPSVRVQLVLDCHPLEEGMSSNVIGEIKGSMAAKEIVLIGAHLDAWDVGNGAHDDGAGCAHVLEALNLLKQLGLKPHRTIRAVLFTNEEHGAHGAEAYAGAATQAGERHVAALESDPGGFAPRGFNLETDSVTLLKYQRWGRLFDGLNAGRITRGFTGTDIEPLVHSGVPGIGLDPENHRYFDYHHSANDTIDKVNPRELEMGAIAIALLSFMIAESGMD